MNCQQCSSEIPDTAKFCPECGAKIVRKAVCPECGTEAAPGAKFCCECGCRLSGEAASTAKKAPPRRRNAPKASTPCNPQNDDPLTKTVKGIIADMVEIPGKDYSMGKYPVTNAQWQMLTGSAPCRDEGGNIPVHNVSWNDCDAFVEKLNAHPAVKDAGIVFRLPTRNEWTYAARAGATGEDDYCRLADGTTITDENFEEIGWTGIRTREIHSRGVGLKKPNAFGLFDCFYNKHFQREFSSVPLGNGKWHVMCAIGEALSYIESDGKSANAHMRLASSAAGAVPEADVEQESIDAAEELGQEDYDAGMSALRHGHQDLAAEHFREGTEMGHLGCMNQLGMRYLMGSGVEKDETEAVPLFEKAAAGGVPEAMFNLGCCHLKGMGVEKDEEQAMDWFRKAEQLGFEEAKKALRVYSKKKPGDSLFGLVKRFAINTEDAED